MQAEGVEAFGYKQELKRSLSLFDLLVYGLVFIVPGAPISVFGIVFNAGKGMVPLVYLIGLIAMVFTAFSYMAMSRAFPVAGSVYTYAGRSIGPTAGFFTGWAMLLDYLLLPTLVFVVIAIAIQASVPIVPKPVWVVSMVLICTLVNYFGIETTARMSVAMLVLQLVLLVVFFVMGVSALAHGTAGAHLSLAPFYNPAVLTPSLVFGALSLAVLSFLGFDAISTLSEEARGGPAMIGRATILSLCLSAVLFVAQTYLACLFVLGRTSFAPGDPTNDAFYDIAYKIGGYWLKFLMTVPMIVIGGIAGALTAQAATARLLFSMARDGKLPRTLAHIDPVRKVPIRATLLIAAITLVLGIALVDRLELLTSMVSFGALIGFLMLHLSVIVHFRDNPNRLRHFVLPAIGLVIIAYVLWNAEINAKIAGLCWMAVGVAFYAVMRRSIEPASLL
jgi:amino acid transporter